MPTIMMDSRDLKFQLLADEIRAAEARLAGQIRRTPALSSNYHPAVLLKAENLQLTGSFKIRPALNQVLCLTPEQKASGLVTSSSGNFAQAAAYAATQAGASAKIVMTKSSSPLKQERTKRFGGEVILCEDHFEARAQGAERIRSEEGRTPIFPYDHIHAIAGNGTLGLEILEQFPDVRNVVVPVSGGGMISGIAAAIKLNRPEIKVWGVQSAGSNATVLSFRKREPVSLQSSRSIADGLLATTPGKLTFPIVLALVEDVVEVAEESIRRAVRHLILEEKLVVEPSGAVTLAAVMEGKVPADQTVLVLSGGNISPELLCEIVG